MKYPDADFADMLMRRAAKLDLSKPLHLSEAEAKTLGWKAPYAESDDVLICAHRCIVDIDTR